MSSSKEKTLKLLEIMQKETDVNNGLKVSELIEKLSQAGYDCDRRSIATDLAAFDDAGFAIGKDKARYFIKDNTLTVSDEKLLADLVLSATSIPKEKADCLFDSITSRISEKDKEILFNQFVIDAKVRTENTEVSRNVELIVEAINSKKSLQFNYKTKSDKKGMKHYFIPYATVWNNQRYYVIGYDIMPRRICNLLVEKMYNMDYSYHEYIAIEETMEYGKDFDIGRYVNDTYNMFTGNIVKAIIQYDISIHEYIEPHLKFKIHEGDDFISKSKDKRIVACDVAESDGFVSFVLQFGDKIKILSPQSLVEKVKKQIVSIANMYK